MNHYKNYSDYIKEHFDYKVQKISINAGFTCPNRDGSIGVGGCTYCNNRSFNPDYCVSTTSVTKQLEEGKIFFRRKAKYAGLKFLAYFQAYTNTYGEFSRLKSLYEEALACEDVVGLVIGTRPDCVDDRLLDYFQDLSKEKYVMIEYGVESTDDNTLKRINRGHDFACACKAIRDTASRGIQTGAHLILGLPGETPEMILKGADRMSELPIDIIKLHQLQIVRDTPMADEYAKNPDEFKLFSIEAYQQLLAEFIEHLRDDICIERFVSQTPKSILVAPDWGLKNYEFTDRLNKIFEERGTAQGKLKMLNAKC